jgi:hypothetical protein
MTSLYSDYLGKRGTIGSLYPNTPTAIDYPSADQYNVFPTLYLPRIYGKDLTAFEIASSGTIAVTIRDVHSIDLDRNITTSNVTLSTLCNDSFMIGVNNNSMFLNFDSLSNNINLTSSNDIALAASNAVNIKAKTFNLDISSDLNLKGLNINATAVSNIRLTATNDSIFMTSGSNLVVATSNNTTFYTGKSLTLAANRSNMSLFMNADTNNTLLYSSNNIGLTASNDVNILSVQRTFITTGATTSITSASNTTIRSTTGLVTLSNSQGGSIVLNNNLNVDVISSLNLSASNGGVLIKLGAHSNNGVMTADGSWTIIADSNTRLSARTIELYANNSNMSLVMNSNNNTTTLYSSNDVRVSTSNNISLVSIANTTLTASNTMTIASLRDANITSKTGIVTVSAIDQASTISLSSNVDISTNKDINIEANSNLVIAIDNSNMTLVFNGTTDNVALTTVGSTTVKSRSNVTIQADYGNFSMYANQSNVSITTDKTTNALSVYALGGIKTTASNTISTITYVGAISTLSASSNTMAANGGVQFVKLNADATLTAQATNYTFAVGATNVVDINAQRLRVNGNLEITGTVDTINIKQTTLQVRDKEVFLAYSSNNDVFDGVTNTGAGILIQGVPPTANPVTQSNLYEKSLKWNVADGMNLLGTASYSNESYWELKGGGLRITHNKSETEELAFGFRINEQEELEIVKKYWSGTAYTYKRIAKFGRTLL